jgi:protease-4
VKKFLGRVFASAAGLALLLCLSLLVMVAVSSEAPLEIEPGSILVLDLSTPISDRGIEPKLTDRMQGAETPLQLHRVTSALKLAAADDRIGGLFMHGAPSGIGWASVREMREAIQEFKDNNKPVYSWFPNLTESTFSFATLADPSWSAPFGTFMLDGFAAEVMYFKDLLENIGVEIQVTRVGKYKSAVEPFMLDRMSKANREQIENFTGDLFEVAMEDSASSLGVSREELRSRATERGAMRTEQAAEAGLLSGILYWDEVLEKLAELAPAEDGFAQVSFSDYLDATPNEKRESSGTVAVVFAEGEIYDGSGENGVAGDSVAKELRELRLDDEVDAVVLRVNSPGGSATASETILREMELLKAQKPVVVSMGNVAASGGYWISCKANQIFVQPNTITGSIGVFGMLPNCQGLLDEIGIRVETVRTGPLADMHSFFRPKTKEELAVIQSFVDDIYEGFLDRVADGRGMDRNQVHEIAQGRVWSGKDAVELGLADSFGGLQDAANAAAELAGLSDDFELDFPTEDPGVMDLLLESLIKEEETENLAGAAAPFLSLLDSFPRFGARNGVYARIPWEIRIR